MQFVRSERGVSSLKTESPFSTGKDSPVRADSSTEKADEESILASAVALSPAFRYIISPGTRRDESTVCLMPFLKTVHFGTIMLLRASIAASARLSCTIPIIALTMTMERIIKGSVKSFSPPRSDTP